MDIMERTGSGVYDLQLRSRIGDLSGLSSGYLYGDDEPGFGIFTDNGFFKGSITAMTGSIQGILHVATQAGGIETGNKISIGRNVKSTNDGIYVNDNNYWYTDSKFRIGNTVEYLYWDGSNLNISSSNIDVNVDNLHITASDIKLHTEDFDLNVTGSFRMSASRGDA